MDIIDFRMRPKTPYFMQGITPNPTVEFQRYIKLYKATVGKGRLEITNLQSSTEEMHSKGVTKGVIVGGDIEGNKIVYETIQEFPDDYIGLAGVDITQGVTKGLEELEKCYTEYNLPGLNVSSYLSGVYANDPKMYPLYALSEKMGKLVSIHASLHYNPARKMDLGNPYIVDEIAVDFPNLRIVIAHAGSGYGMTAAWIADRHKNIYLDFSGLHPRYTDPMMSMAINTVLQKKAIYGSGHPCLHFDIHKEWKHVIHEGNQQNFFHDNALRALGML